MTEHLERRIAELERELGEVKSEQGQIKTDVISLKSEIAQARVDIDRATRKVMESQLENRRSDKNIMDKIDDMRSAVVTMLEYLQPKVIVAQASPPTPATPPFGKES